jgi:signal transduction histidine kinase
MNLRVRFSLILAVIVMSVILIASIVSLRYLSDFYHLIVNAPNHGIAVAMAHRIFMKAAISYCVIILCIILLSIPVSIWFSKVVSRPYLDIIKRLFDRACDRLKIDVSVNLQKDERIILHQYVEMLQEDVGKLQDYEKIKSWKNGARLLMHELKNPLTPLKLSAQNLLLQTEGAEKYKPDITRITTAINDIERILCYFKELVNIEFGRKEELDIVAFHDGLIEENKVIFPGLKCGGRFNKPSILITAEATLLKMLFMNLIKNGMEQNKEKFYMAVSQTHEYIFFEFVTPDIIVEDMSKLFHFGYSTKGSQRGYGLFLCKMISDYLGFALSAVNKHPGIIFTIAIKTNI